MRNSCFSIVKRSWTCQLNSDIHQSIGGVGFKYNLTRYLESEGFREVVTHM